MASFAAMRRLLKLALRYSTRSITAAGYLNQTSRFLIRISRSHRATLICPKSAFSRNPDSSTNLLNCLRDERLIDDAKITPRSDDDLAIRKDSACYPIVEWRGRNIVDKWRRIFALTHLLLCAISTSAYALSRDKAIDQFSS